MKRSVYRVTYRTWPTDSYFSTQPKTVVVIAHTAQAAWSVAEGLAHEDIHIQDISFECDIDAEERVL